MREFIKASENLINSIPNEYHKTLNIQWKTYSTQWLLSILLMTMMNPYTDSNKSNSTDNWHVKAFWKTEKWNVLQNKIEKCKHRKNYNIPFTILDKKIYIKIRSYWWKRWWKNCSWNTWKNIIKIITLD